MLYILIPFKFNELDDYLYTYLPKKMSCCLDLFECCGNYGMFYIQKKSDHTLESDKQLVETTNSLLCYLLPNLSKSKEVVESYLGSTKSTDTLKVSEVTFIELEQLKEYPQNGTAEEKKDFHYSLSFQYPAVVHEPLFKTMQPNSVFKACNFISEKKLETCSFLNSKLRNLSIGIGNYFKCSTNRERPYVEYPQEIIQQISERKDSNCKSYPSTHATKAWLFALFLSDLSPKDKMKFFAKAKEIADSRIIAGFHYQSDITQGCLLAYKIFDILKGNQDFCSTIVALKEKEWQSSEQCVDVKAQQNVQELTKLSFSKTETLLFSEHQDDLVKSCFKLCALSPYPEENSHEYKLDIHLSLATQYSADLQDIEDAKSSVRFEIDYFTDQINKQTAIWEFFLQVHGFAISVNNLCKDRYRRTRPYNEASAGIGALLPVEEDDRSYPSFHATRAWIYALVLNKFDKVMKEKELTIKFGDTATFFKKARDLGNHRIIGGMHYHSDIIAGYVLAEHIFSFLEQQDTFIKKINDLIEQEFMHGIAHENSSIAA